MWWILPSFNKALWFPLNIITLLPPAGRLLPYGPQKSPHTHSRHSQSFVCHLKVLEEFKKISWHFFIYFFQFKIIQRAENCQWGLSKACIKGLCDLATTHLMAISLAVCPQTLQWCIRTACRWSPYVCRPDENSVSSPSNPWATQWVFSFSSCRQRTGASIESPSTLKVNYIFDITMVVFFAL